MARRNEKNLIWAKSQYNYIQDTFKGVDLTSPASKCDAGHASYLVNLYRDKDKKDGALLESVPGYRMIAKDFLHVGEIYGIYAHAFLVDGKRENYILVHKGGYLYSFLQERRDMRETLSPIAALSSSRSFGFAYGGCFYLLDGQNIYEMKTPHEAVVLGNESEENAYIPLIMKDGVPYEARNMLTGFFELERTVEKDMVADDAQGLFYRECFLGEQRGLEVYGMEEGRRVVAVPSSVLFEGEMLPVLAVAPNAFKGRDIVTAVFAPSVKIIGAGAFAGCSSLERILIHGSPEIRSEAFKGCASLVSLAVHDVVMSVDETAFEGCATELHIFLADIEKKGWLSRFDETATFYTDTLFFWLEKGERFYFSWGMGNYQTFEAIYGDESRALTDCTIHEDITVTGELVNRYFTARAENTVAYAQYFMRSAVTDVPRRHIFVSVCDAFGGINTRDEVEAFVISFPDYTERLVSLTLNGEEITQEPNAKGVYYVPDYKSGILTGLRAILPRNREGSYHLLARCYGTKQAKDGSDEFYRVNSHYKGTASDALKSCRFAAVFDGRVFLGGNPDLPDTVFHSVTPKRESDSLTFASTAYLSCRDTAGAVSAFAVHPLYLALIKDRSVYGVTRKSGTGALHESYEINGWCSSPEFVGSAYTYGDEPLFLSKSGVMALTPGKAWEEGRIENRSYYIDRLLGRLSCENAVFCEWNGYLVLLIDGKIFLGDATVAEKKNGSLAYEWYFLDGIGHYEGDALCYHHLSYDPIVWDTRLSSLTLDGKKLLILGKEEPVTGEVFSTEIDGITVYYTVGEDLEYYLVDSYGEKTGGFFSPATRVLSTDGCLYVSTADGYLFCFNTDKRGKSVLVNDMLESVGEDEIHSSFYSFDGHAYPSRLVTVSADMGVPHLLKSTVPRSLVVQGKAIPHAAFTVSVRKDGFPWEEAGFVVANTLDRFDADRFVFSPDDTVSEVLADSTRAWLSKQVMISAEVFESPIGIDSIAYRYKMAGRVKSKTK